MSAATGSDPSGRAPRRVAERHQRPQFDERVRVAEEDAPGQVDEVARVPPEVRPRFHEFGTQDPERQSAEGVLSAQPDVVCLRSGVFIYV